jgi:hypothetical protein
LFDVRNFGGDLRNLIEVRTRFYAAPDSADIKVPQRHVGIPEIGAVVVNGDRSQLRRFDA